MTIRILAVIAEAQTVATCLDLAVAAASRIGDATIEALHVMVDPRRLDTAAEEVDFQLMREVEEGSAQDRAEAVRAAFDAWMARNPAAAPSVVWRKCVGSEERRVSQEARDFDLLVLATRSPPPPSNATSRCFSHPVTGRRPRAELSPAGSPSPGTAPILVGAR